LGAGAALGFRAAVFFLGVSLLAIVIRNYPWGKGPGALSYFRKRPLP
jgi:hypothetical protein